MSRSRCVHMTCRREQMSSQILVVPDTMTSPAEVLMASLARTCFSPQSDSGSTTADRYLTKHCCLLQLPYLKHIKCSLPSLQSQHPSTISPFGISFADAYYCGTWRTQSGRFVLPSSADSLNTASIPSCQHRPPSEQMNDAEAGPAA